MVLATSSKSETLARDRRGGGLVGTGVGGAAVAVRAVVGPVFASLVARYLVATRTQ